MKTWKKIKEDPPIKVGYRRLLVKTFKMPSGHVREWAIKDEEVSVAILAITEGGKVILAKQFRPGPEKIILDLPGGRLESKETTKQAAARELLEETGYKGSLKLVGQSLDCAYSNRLRYNFVATDCQKIAKPSLDEHEYIEVVLMTLGEFREHLRSGQLTDVETGYLGLDYLGLL